VIGEYPKLKGKEISTYKTSDLCIEEVISFFTNIVLPGVIVAGMQWSDISMQASGNARTKD